MTTKFNRNLDEELNSLINYERSVVETDQFSPEDIMPILMGLYGEIGSIMSASKKKKREGTGYANYEDSMKEEFGDVLWYFSAICRRMGVSLESVFRHAIIEVYARTKDAQTCNNDVLDSVLIDLGCLSAGFLKQHRDSIEFKAGFVDFACTYIQATRATKISVIDIINKNLSKVQGLFLLPPELPDFDADFLEEEQLPREFEIHFTQRNSGQCYLKWNGVFIGSPLTDNIGKSDGYRFHDVFHLAHAAILHWSPTFRALIKQKRKSDPKIDEAQDGGRAIVVEEGLTAWLFSYSKNLEYFTDHDSVSFEVLKTIQNFVKGYEVAECPLKLWEKAIIQGYSVFRKVKENGGGIVLGNRDKRTISYKAFGD